MRRNIRFVALLVIATVSIVSGQTLCPTLKSEAHEAVKYGAFENGRISGGQETTPNEFPWQAYITVNFWNGGSAICGGTLISDEWILSATHCFEGVINMTVTLGAHDTSGESSEVNREVFDLTPGDVVKHPGWYFPLLEGDVSLIHLSRRVPFSNYIRPINLPYRDDPSFESESVILTGWGNFSSVEDSGVSPVLRKTQTFVLGSQGVNPACQRVAGQNFDGNKIICGDGVNSHRSCYGDDGGPMNYYRVDESAWVVVGVATLGDSTPACAISTKPSLYNRVSYYLDWIYNNTNIPPRVRTTTTSTTTTTTTTTTRTTTKEPTTVTSGPYDYVCRGNPNGDYPIPDAVCSEYFISCSNGIAYVMKCALLDTVFYYPECRCDYTWLVPECPDYVTTKPASWLRLKA